MAEYNFNIQDPYAAQAADIARRQKMAEIMQAQALQPIEKFSYNGIEARISPYQGLAKMLQAYMGGRGQAAALEEQKALGEKVRSEQQGQIKDFMSAMTGTPETTVSTGPIAPELMTEERMPFTTDKIIPAVAPDRQKALALALQSSSPMLQSAGGSLLTSILPKTPKWQASTRFNDNGEEIHGFVDINSTEPQNTFVASSTKPAALVPVTTTDANGRPVQKFVNARTVSGEGIPKPLEGFYGELEQMGVDLNSPQVKSVLNSYVAGKSGNVTAKDAVDFQIKLANLGLSSQRAAYEVPGGGAAMPNIPKPFNLFDMNRPPSAAAPQSNMPPAMPAQMPNQAPAQMPAQPPAAKLANALRNAPVTTAPTAAPAVIPNAAPVRANIPNVASTAAPVAAPATPIPGGFDVSKLSPKDRNELLKHQIIDDGKPLTEFQGKATGYAARMLQANDILSSIGQNGRIQPGEIKRTLLGIPLVGNFLGRQANFTQSEAQQQIEQAQLNFVNALLRQESGASIQSPEFESATRQYFPQPGDKDLVLKQKAQNRAVAIKALEIEAGPGLQRMQKAQKLDNDALTWANANPNDPRSAAIKQKLGQ
jgi:hypothetical protein